MNEAAIRSTALQHLNCNVTLDIYSDQSVCLICEDHDVVITNFGSCCIRDVMRPAPKIRDQGFKVIESFEDPKFIEMEEMEGEDDAEPDRVCQRP
jgi:hypothetical protein